MEPTTTASGGKPSTTERFKALLAEWGPLFFIVWFGIFGLVLVGFALAIKFGFRVESSAGTWGTWGAAWVATQVVKPVRIAATIVITPALGALLKRFRRSRSIAPGAPPAAPSDAEVARGDLGSPPLDETPGGPR
jgi:hypothetical protein